MDLLTEALTFSNERKRKWIIINFVVGNKDDRKTAYLRRKCIPNPDYNYFQPPIGLYYSPGRVKKYLLKVRKGKRYVHFYKNLHIYLKTEKADDSKFRQSILQNLPKSYLQRYYQERSEDPDESNTTEILKQILMPPGSSDQQDIESQNSSLSDKMDGLRSHNLEMLSQFKSFEEEKKKPQEFIPKNQQFSSFEP